MAVRRLDNVGVVVSDLDAGIRFFEELGLVLEGRQFVEGEWVDGVVGVDGVRSEIAVLTTEDGIGRVELARYHSPTASPSEPAEPPANTLGLTRMMFAVDDIDDVVARLAALGGRVLRRVEQYESYYRLCYLRGPDGIVIALAQEL